MSNHTARQLFYLTFNVLEKNGWKSSTSSQSNRTFQIHILKKNINCHSLKGPIATLLKSKSVAPKSSIMPLYLFDALSYSLPVSCLRHKLHWHESKQLYKHTIDKWKILWWSRCIILCSPYYRLHDSSIPSQINCITHDLWCVNFLWEDSVSGVNLEKKNICMKKTVKQSEIWRP